MELVVVVVTFVGFLHKDALYSEVAFIGISQNNLIKIFIFLH